MNGDVCKPRTRTRRFWDKYGSWLILILVVAVTWNAATEWEATKTRSLIEAVLESSAAERDELRSQLESLKLIDKKEDGEHGAD